MWLNNQFARKWSLPISQGKWLLQTPDFRDYIKHSSKVGVLWFWLFALKSGLIDFGSLLDTYPTLRDRSKSQWRTAVYFDIPEHGP